MPLFFPRISAKVEREDKIRKLGGNIDEKHNLLQPPEIVENLFIRLIRKNEELCVCIIFIEQERGEIEMEKVDFLCVFSLSTHECRRTLRHSSPLTRWNNVGGLLG